MFALILKIKLHNKWDILPKYELGGELCVKRDDILALHLESRLRVNLKQRKL